MKFTVEREHLLKPLLCTRPAKSIPGTIGKFRTILPVPLDFSTLNLRADLHNNRAEP
jgi:hypothetical protein